MARTSGCRNRPPDREDAARRRAPRSDRCSSPNRAAASSRSSGTSCRRRSGTAARHARWGRSRPAGPRHRAHHRSLSAATANCRRPSLPGDASQSSAAPRAKNPDTARSARAVPRAPRASWPRATQPARARSHRRAQRSAWGSPQSRRRARRRVRRQARWQHPVRPVPAPGPCCRQPATPCRRDPRWQGRPSGGSKDVRVSWSDPRSFKKVSRSTGCGRARLSISPPSPRQMYRAIRPHGFNAFQKEYPSEVASPQSLDREPATVRLS